MRIVKCFAVVILAACNAGPAGQPAFESSAVTVLGGDGAPLPSCDLVARPAKASRVSLRQLAAGNLVVAYVDNEAVCADTEERASRAGLAETDPASEPVVPPPPTAGTSGTGSDTGGGKSSGGSNPTGSGDPMPSKGGSDTSPTGSGDPMPSSGK